MFSKHISISSLSSMATKEGNKSHIHSILTWCAPSPVVSEAFLFGMAGCPLHLEGPLESFSWLNSGNCSFLGLQCYICIYIYVYKDYFQHRRNRGMGPHSFKSAWKRWVFVRWCRKLKHRRFFCFGDGEYWRQELDCIPWNPGCFNARDPL